MNNQEAFDKVVKHLRRQGERATDGSKCCYRTNEGLMCAVGCLIPDSLYTPHIEGVAIDCCIDVVENKSGLHIPDVVRAVSRITDHLAGLDFNLLEALQWTHDQHPPDEWEDSFITIAKDFNLSIPEKESNDD